VPVFQNASHAPASLLLDQWIDHLAICLYYTCFSICLWHLLYLML
jgi:hypothetical protein